MRNFELLQTQDPQTSPGQVVKGGAAHATNTDNYYVITRHFFTYLLCNLIWGCIGIYSRGIAVPGIFILIVKTEVLAVNNIVWLSGPPQAQLAGISGSFMIPR